MILQYIYIYIHIYIYTYIQCPRRNVPNSGRVFLMLKYNDITQNTYVHLKMADNLGRNMLL